MQPHLDAGVRFSAVINDRLRHQTFNDVLKDSAEKKPIGATRTHSYMKWTKRFGID
jgi:hypothetical protein